jgi:hypothetical protein
MKQFSVLGSQFSVAMEMKQVSQMVGWKAKLNRIPMGHGSDVQQTAEELQRLYLSTGSASSC